MIDRFCISPGFALFVKFTKEPRGIANYAYLQFSFSGCQVERFKGNGYEMLKKKKKDGFCISWKQLVPREARAPPKPLCILPHDPGRHLLPAWGSLPFHHGESSALTRPGLCFSFQPFSTKYWTHIPWEAAGCCPVRQAAAQSRWTAQSSTSGGTGYHRSNSCSSHFLSLSGNRGFLWGMGWTDALAVHQQS